MDQNRDPRNLFDWANAQAEPDVPEAMITVQAISDILAELESINRRLEAIEGGLRGVENAAVSLRVDLIEVHNREIQAFNRQRYGDAGQRHLPLQPLLRMRAPNGRGILDRPRAQPQPQQPVPVGAAFPSPPFPATVSDVLAMTMDEIDELAIVMDDDFGIVRGDSIATCRGKVIRAITGQ